MNQPITLFYSYSHEDEELLEQLRSQLSGLRRLGLVEDWHDRQIGAGAEWQPQLLSQLDAAQIILLLISSQFLASDYCYKIEMKRALERHADENVRVIPIILRPCYWENQPFAQLQVLPADGRPVTRRQNRDQVLTEIARVIGTVVEELRQSMTLAEPTSAPESQAHMRLGTGAMPPDSPFYILAFSKNTFL